jgi:Reverse transcriptase (RNA-dependent DNA polymerase)
MILNGFLYDYQHGFVNGGRSCTTQPLKVMDYWSEVMDCGGAVDDVYLDYAKALGTVPHGRLLCKLTSYGIEGQLLKWIRSFLTERRQRVGVAGTLSTRTKILSGVP